MNLVGPSCCSALMFGRRSNAALPGSWPQCMRKSERRLPMNGRGESGVQLLRGSVLDCASPLALSHRRPPRNSARGQAQSTTWR